MFYLGFSYFNAVSKVGQQNIHLTHNRLLNVLGGIRSQWLIQGQPTELTLNWQTEIEPNDYSVSHVQMSSGGWPIPSETNVAGCRQLMESLLGENYQQTLITKYDFSTASCRYIGTAGGSINYQTISGRVIFLTEEG
nr:hypothetical protein [Shewanella sairae]